METTSDFFTQLKIQIEVAVKQSDFSKITSLLDGLLENLVQHFGNDIIQLKMNLAFAVFLLSKITKLPCGDRLILDFFEAESIGKLQQLMQELKQEYAGHFCVSEEPTQRNAIEQAVRYVKKYYHRKISQSGVAKSVYLSPSYFSQLFREMQGVCFSDFVNQVRIDHAKELLLRRTIPPDKIYRMVGYTSRSYYIKMFRKHTGTTPTSYRNRFLT